MLVSHRTVPIILATTLALLAFAGCGGSDGDSPTISKNTSGAAAATPGVESAQSLALSDSLSRDATGAPAGASAPDASAKSAEAFGSGGSGNSGGLPDSSADFARKVIVNASLSLKVQDVNAAFAEANRLARTAGGYVQQSSFINVNDNKDAPQRTASITLRIPSAQYEATLASLRGIEGAKVVSEGSKSSEITEQYTDLQSRLRNLERSEAQYLTLMDQAKTIADIIQLTDRLDGVRGQIEQIQGRLNVLDQLVDLATIEVSLAPFTAGTGASDDSDSLGDIFASAWERSLDAAGLVAAGAIYAGVAIVWLALPAGLVLLIYRRVVRKETPPSAAA